MCASCVHRNSTALGSFPAVPPWGSAFCGVVLAAFAVPGAEDVFASGATRRELYYATADERFELSMMGATACMDYAEDEDFQLEPIEYTGSKLALFLSLPERAAYGEEALQTWMDGDGTHWRLAPSHPLQRRTLD